MQTKGKLIAFAAAAAVAAYGTSVRTGRDLKPVQAGIHTATIGDGSAVARADTGPEVIKITASKFQFSPNQITLKKGRPVLLQLMTTDRTHGLLLRALKIDTNILPGKTTEVKVTPPTTGKFSAICDHYCGLGHGGMKMTVVVE
jgi:cytochrome c oxidase subunit 2